MPWGAMPVVRRLTAFRMHSRHTHRTEIDRFLELSRGISREGYIGRLRILQQDDMRHHLQELRIPTLFLASDLDYLVPSLEQGRIMAALAPEATLQVLEGHGHICLIAPGIDLADILARWRGL